MISLKQGYRQMMGNLLFAIVRARARYAKGDLGKVLKLVKEGNSAVPELRFRRENRCEQRKQNLKNFLQI